MATSLLASIEFPASLAVTFAMFSDVRYLELKCAESSESSFSVERQGDLIVVDVVRTMTGIPDSFQKFVGDAIQLHERQGWKPNGHQRFTADVDMDVVGKPVTMTGKFVLEELDGGTKLTLEGTVHVGIPLFGGMAEGYIRDHLQELLHDEQAKGLQWLAAHS